MHLESCPQKHEKETKRNKGIINVADNEELRLSSVLQCSFNGTEIS